jgi:hypothetical protein
VGQIMSMNVTNLPFNAAVIMVGLSDTTSTFGPLPLDLGAGAPGCVGRVSTDITAFVLGAGGVANYTLPVPDVPSVFVGLPLWTQAIVFDTTNAFGFTESDSAALVIGL